VLNQYGLSARGLAIDTSVPGVSEELPVFTHFWLEQGPEDSLIVYALLDSASVTGAYRFVNRKNARAVTQDITLALFPRKAIAQLGIAPLTSMFWYGEGNRPQATDWRPEVHDSDGLALLTGRGERLWRPLANPPHPTTNSFSDHNPKGFGLLQRDRSFDHYQDDGVFYERRPSLWATARKPLGAGQVRLYAFPTDSEYTDNVAAYWTPAAPVRGGSRIETSYRLDWTAARAPASAGLATVENIWLGKSEPDGERLLIDFSGVPDKAQPDIWVDLAGATLVKKAGYPVLHQKGLFRVVLDIRRDRGKAADIRAQLRAGNRPFSEYVHYPLGA
jgi:glucans biosynthesis protein